MNEHPSLNIAFTKEVKTMEGKEPLFRYYYSANYNGFPVSRYKLLTRTEFISVTGIDPVTNKCIYT